MSPCHLAQSLCPHHLPFDLFHPSSRRLFHTFLNSLPASAPSHQIKERQTPPEKCHFLCGCCYCSKPFFLTPFHSQVFFFFFPFLSSPGKKTRGGEGPNMQPAGRKAGSCSSLSISLVHRCVILTSLAAWPDSLLTMYCTLLCPYCLLSHIPFIHPPLFLFPSQSSVSRDGGIMSRISRQLVHVCVLGFIYSLKPAIRNNHTCFSFTVNLRWRPTHQRWLTENN